MKGIESLQSIKNVFEGKGLLFGAAFLLLLACRWKRILIWCVFLVGLLIGWAVIAVREKPIEGREFRKPKFGSWDDLENDYGYESSKWDNVFDGNSSIKDEIDIFVGNVVQNFVLTWFSSIGRAAHFPDAVSGVVKDSISELSSVVCEIDLSELIILKILPLLIRHYNTFISARETIASDLLLDKPKESLDLAIAVEFNKQYRIHRTLTLTVDEMSLAEDLQSYARTRATEFLGAFVDSKELNSPFVSVLLREIVACSLLQPIFGKISSPDFWNTKLLDICSTALKERSQVKELRAILSKEIQVQHGNHDDQVLTESRLPQIELLALESSDEDFEQFLKQLNNIENIEQLKCIKYIILANFLRYQNTSDPSKGNVLFKKRTELAFNMVSSKNIWQSVNTLKTHEQKTFEDQLSAFSNFVNNIGIHEVIQSKFAMQIFYSYLSKSEEPTAITDFELWKYIANITNPLENVSNEAYDVSASPQAINDLKYFCSEFLQGEMLEHLMKIDYTSVTTIIDFVKGDMVNVSYLSARKCMLLLQQSVFKILDYQWFQGFRSSVAFYDMLCSEGFLQSECFQQFLETERESPSDENQQNDTVKVVAYGDLGKALDDILSSNDSGKTAWSLKNKKSYSMLFGENNDNNLEDSLFETSSNPEQLTSLMSATRQSLSSAEIENELAQSDSLENSSHIENVLSYTNLKEEIGKLALSIDSLRKELELLGHLLLKAELTNNQSQLLLLKRSERTLTRELEYKELLKQQYLVHENANSLFKRAKISIKSYLTDISGHDGKETVYYLISIQHLHNKQIVTWDIPRRFSEFYRLNAYLRKVYSGKVKYLQTSEWFPERVKISLKYHVSKTLLYEERRVRLEKYLRELLKIREICQDEYFRKYLTDVSSTFQVNDTSEFSKEDKRRSVILSRTDSTFAEVTTMDPEMENSNEYQDELNFFEDERNFYTGMSSKSTKTTGKLVKPICELFISFFALNQSNAGWFRGRAIIVILQRLLGSTIEKYIKDLMARVCSSEKVLAVLKKINSILWVDGKFYKSSQLPQPPIRTEGEMNRAKMESLAILDRFMVETCGKVVGTLNARNAAYRLHSVLQNEYLNASLILEISDVIFEELRDVQIKSSKP